ncbi:hypothetical protein SFRURICE_001405 [Spodoptera frugiperda]|nr:hypothetical protein SFRURICE_001405 [Spodoptera frugiperda]
MLEYKLTQHIKTPTRTTHTTATCLDLIFTNTNTEKIYTHVEELGFSDHSGTIIHISVPIRHLTKQTWYVKKRLFNTTNILKFKSKLNECAWKNIITENKTVNENYKAFQDTLINLLNNSIPICKIKLKTNFKKYWLTTGIKISCKNKRLLKILTLKTNNPIIQNYYKKYEKILKKLVNTSKKLQYINKIKTSSNKVKTMWSIINERTNKKPKKVHDNIKLQIDNAEVTEPKQVANIFNNFFASIGENSSSSCSVKQGGTSVLSPTENTMFLGPIGAWEVQR